MTDRWALLRVWHAEAMESVMRDPGGYVFSRTSFAAAPARWREIPPSELSRRVELLLDAHYVKRNATMVTPEDPNRMMLLAFAFEWVDHTTNPARPGGGPDPYVFAKTAHPAVIDRACAEVTTLADGVLEGLDAKVWTSAFGVWRIDDDTWHLIKHQERAAMFAERFGS